MEAIKESIFSRLPTVPKSNKWTQFNGCIDWVFMGIAPHNLLAGLYQHSFGTLTVKMEQKAAAFHKKASADGEYLQEMSWHALVGARMRAGLGLMNDTFALSSIAVLMIIIEPLQYLVRWLFIVERGAKDVSCGPPIFDLVTVRYSPLLVIRQYLSSIVSGRCSRLLLVIRFWGCETLAELVEQFPETAMLIRRLVQVCDAWVYRRLWKQYASWPWLIAAVADVRNTLEYRLGIAASFIRSPCRFCLDEFFLRRLIEKFPMLTPIEFVTGPLWQTFIYNSAVSIMLHIATIETRHARNRRTHAVGTNLVTFISKYLVQEAAHIQRSLLGVVHLHNTRGSDVPERADDAQHSPAFMRRISACLRQMNTQQVMQLRERVMGLKLPRDQTSVRERLVSLEAHDYELLDHIAQSTVAIARANSAAKHPLSRSHIGVIATASSSESLRPSPCRYDSGLLNSLNAWIAVPPEDLSLPAQTDELALPSIDDPPVSVAIFNSVVSNTFGKGTGLHSNYKFLVSHVGTGLVDDIKTTVVYPKQCNALCEGRSPVTQHQFLAYFREVLDKFRNSTFGKTTRVPCADPLFAFKLTPRAGGAPIVVFALMPIATGGFGMTKPTFTFELLKATSGSTDGDGSYIDLVLAMQYEDHIDMRCSYTHPSLFSNAQGHGTLKTFSEDEWVQHLFQAAPMNRLVWIQMVRLRHTPYIGDWLDKFVVVEKLEEVFHVDPSNLPRKRRNVKPAASSSRMWVDRNVGALQPDHTEATMPPLVDLPCDDDCLELLERGAAHNVLKDEDDRADDDDHWTEPPAAYLNESSDDEPAEGADITALDFPPPPHDLTSLMDWGTPFTLQQTVRGLAYVPCECRSDWYVWVAGRRVGRLMSHGGKVLRGECGHHHDADKDRCRVSLAMRRQTTSELRDREVSIFRWLVQGYYTSQADHKASGRALEAATHVVRDGPPASDAVAFRMLNHPAFC